MSTSTDQLSAHWQNLYPLFFLKFSLCGITNHCITKCCDMHHTKVVLDFYTKIVALDVDGAVAILLSQPTKVSLDI